MFHNKTVASLMLLILLSSTFIGGITFTVAKNRMLRNLTVIRMQQTVSVGSNGQEVQDLQNILLKLGYDIRGSTADGDFGPATEAAVKQFQQASGLTTDGIVGHGTWSALCSAAGSNTQAPTEQPAAPTEQPAAPTEQPAAPTEQPAAPTEQPAAPTEQPAAPIDGASISGSSDSSGSGTTDNNGGSPPATTGTAKVDVRATHIGGILSSFPIWHLFIIYTDSSGTEYYYRGGPGGPGGDPQYGSIKGNFGPYTAGPVDWDPGAPSITVLSGSTANGKYTCFESELVRIDGLGVAYRPLGPNSNTVAKTLLENCGISPQKPVSVAPGWGDPKL